MKMGWMCNNDEETTNTKVKQLLLKFRLPWLPQEGLFIIFIIITIIIIIIIIIIIKTNYKIRPIYN